MTAIELSLAIKAAKRLPRPARSVTVHSKDVPGLSLTLTPRKDGSLLPKGVYRGHKGRFVVRVPCSDGDTKYRGTFPTVQAAFEAITKFALPTAGES